MKTFIVTKENLDKFEDTLNLYLDIVKGARQYGGSFTRECAKRGINYATFRKDMASMIQHINRTSEPVHIDISGCVCPDERFYSAVFEIPLDDNIGLNTIMPEDSEETMNYILDKYFAKASGARAKTGEVLKLYYIDHLTLREVGARFGFTAERARQIIAKGIRICQRNSVINDILRIGVRFAKDTELAYNTEYEKAVNEKVKELMELDEKLQKLDALKKIKKIRIKFGEDNATSDDYVDELDRRNALKSTTIDDLDFSIRTYNCLYRADIHNLFDLISCTEDDIIHMRNMGRKSLEEIKSTLSEFGLSLAK